MTPLGVKHEDAYAQVYPFTAIFERMVQHEMIEKMAELMRRD